MAEPARLPAAWRPLAALLLGSLLGGRGRKALYRLLCGYAIAPDAAVGLAFIRVAAARLGPGSRIGHFTMVRNLVRLDLGAGARIGTFNWIFGMMPSARHFTAERVSALVMEEEAALTSRHIVDCTDRVTLGAFSTVAGFFSQILSHGIDVGTNRQTSAPVVVGRHALVGTRVVLLKGAVVPDRAVVAAGSVFRGAPGGTGGLWSGVPEVRVKETDEGGAYFTRTAGPVE